MYKIVLIRIFNQYNVLNWLCVTFCLWIIALLIPKSANSCVKPITNNTSANNPKSDGSKYLAKIDSWTNWIIATNIVDIEVHFTPFNAWIFNDI